MEKYTRKKADEYIQKNKQEINPLYRYTYHVMGEIGWINDPNGFSFFNGKYHLFYQHYPYKAEWGPMHWGHVSSPDLVQWKYEPIALAPDEEYDQSGCFSGTAIVDNDDLVLMYTGHLHPEGEPPSKIKQVQCLATSKDGVTFDKIKANPVIDSNQLPNHANPQDFRDPKLFKKDGMYYSIIGSMNSDDSGQLLLYRSKDKLEWEYVNVLLQSNNEMGKMWECPDYVRLNQKDILIISPQFMSQKNHRFTNVHSSFYMIGSLDLEQGNYRYESYEEIDFGFDFYAPQTLQAPDGRTLLIAWMRMWDDPIPTQNHKWAGGMTIPRELKLIDNHLYQSPIKELKTYRQNEVHYKDIIIEEAKELKHVSGTIVDLDLTFSIVDSEIFGLRLFKNSNEETVLKFNPIKEEFTFQRDSEIFREKHTKTIPVSLENNQLHLRILLDVSSVEIFLQHGKYTFTSTVYTKTISETIEFFSKGQVRIHHLSKFDIVMDGRN